MDRPAAYADDDEIVRLTASLMLQSSGIEVVATVEDGQAAIDLAQSGMIDVLVLDMEMPKMSGPEALGRIRQLCPDVRVLIHSSLPASTTAAKMLAMGAVAYVEKPCTPERMVQAVRDAARPM